MKKLFLLLSILFLITSCNFSQESPKDPGSHSETVVEKMQVGTVEEIIKYADELEMKLIIRSDIFPQIFPFNEGSAEGGELLVYREKNGDLTALEVKYFGETGKKIEKFFFGKYNEEEVTFMSSEIQHYDMEKLNIDGKLEIESKEISTYYLYDNKLIQYKEDGKKQDVTEKIEKEIQEKLQDILKKVKTSTQTKSKLQKITEDFAPKIGMKKEDVKSGKYRFLEGKQKDGFQITNPNYPKEKYNEIEKVFTGWEIPFAPADGIAESMVWYQKDDMMCKLHIKLNATLEEIDNDTYKDKNYTVNITCFEQDKKEPKASHSQKQKRVYFSLSADGMEPLWYIRIDGNLLSFSHSGHPDGYTNYHINSISTQKNKIEFEGEYVQATFEKKNCLSDGLGIWLPYTVSFVLEGDMVFKGCGDEKLDEFFVKGKKGKCAEIATKTDLDLDDEGACEYNIEAVEGPYFWASFSYEVGGYEGVYKKTTTGYQVVWEGQDISEDACIDAINRHQLIAYNPDFPFSDCEENIRKTSGDEKNNIQTQKNTKEEFACVGSAFALIRQSVEVKNYIDDMEVFLSTQDEKTKNDMIHEYGFSKSLTNFGLEKEQADHTAITFALKETHKEEDGTERETTTKRFKIENLDLMPQEYVIELNDYEILTPTESEEKLQALKSEYAKACSIR